LKLGNEILYAFIPSSDRAMILSPNKKYELGNDEIFLIMPIKLIKTNEYLGAKDINNNRSIEAYFDFNDSEIHNADGSVAEFKMQYENNLSIDDKYLALLSKITSKKTPLPILNYAKVENGKMTASNLETDLIIKDVDIPSGIYQIINKSANITNEDILDFPKERVYDKNEYYTIRTSEKIYSYFEFKVSNKTFSFYLDKLLLSIGKDSLRPAMSGILIKKTSDNEMFLVTTNANTLCKINITDYCDFEKDDRELEYILPVEYLKDFTKLTEGNLLFRCSLSNIFIEANNLEYITRVIDAKYPKYEGVIPKDNTKKIVFNRDLMNKCLKSKEYLSTIEKYKGQKDIYFVILNNANRLILRVSRQVKYNEPNKFIEDVDLCSIDFNYEETEKSFSYKDSLFLLMPVMGTPEQNTNFIFGKDLFEVMLKTMNDDNITAYFSEFNRAYLFPIEQIESIEEMPKKEVENKIIKKNDWDVTFTNGFNKGQKLSEQEIETIDVYDDFVYGLNFKSGGTFDAKTEETIGLLSITDNPINLAVILEKDPSGFNSNAIKYNQKIKRRLYNLAEKSNRKIVLNNNSSSRINREFPYLLVSENDSKNYDLATEFYEKLETPRNESRKRLIEELEKENQSKKEYEYVLTVRPFDIGTYPKDNFLRFEQQDYQYGVVIYSEPISIREIEHYSLCPITEIKDFDGKFLFYIFSDTKQKIRIKLIKDQRKGYFVNIYYYDNDGIESTEMMSAVNFLKKVNDGDYKLENEIKNESKKENSEITIGYFKVDSENTGFEYAKKINDYFNKWNKIKTLKDKLDFEKLEVPMFGSFENESVLNQIETFEKLGFEFGANEVVRNDFKKEVKKIIDKKIFDREMQKKYGKEDEPVIENEKSFEGEGSKEGKGKLYEFFTPQIVADKMLALAQHYGFKGGNVLEPASGNGRLLKHLKDTNITAFEISKENFEILKKEFPNADLHNYNFEKAFLKQPRFNTLINKKGTETWLKTPKFDLVLANPPYGKFSGLYSSYFNFKGQVEHFFILQTLHLLKKGGLGVYLIPSSFLRNGITYNKVKKEIFEIAELVDAYRLPSNIFAKTQIGTDILILRKK
jgi:hypothetical protein